MHYDPLLPSEYRTQTVRDLVSEINRVIAGLPTGHLSLTAATLSTLLRDIDRQCRKRSDVQEGYVRIIEDLSDRIEVAHAECEDWRDEATTLCGLMGLPDPTSPEQWSALVEPVLKARGALT